MASPSGGYLSPQDRALFAEQGKKNFWFFMKEILGIDKLREQPHKKMADEFQEIIEKETPFALFLWPRETWKSTVITQAGAMWLLVRDPQERILITNAKLENSKAFLRWIKKQFESNEFFRWVYGDMTTKEWYVDNIRVKGYNPSAKEASIQAASIDASVVSQHYTKIIADDLVNRDYVGSDQRVQTTITYYNDLQDLRTHTGQMVLVGTRWADWDLYQFLIDLHPQDPDHPDYDPDWYISIRGIEEPDEDGNMVSIYPDPEFGFPPERIARLKKEKQFEFYAQYMNNPRSDSTFKLPEYGTFIDLKDAPSGILWITVDPAISEREAADESAIVVTLQTPTDDLWVLAARHGRWGVSRFMDELFECFDEWSGFRPIRGVGVETSVAAQRLWKNIIEEEMRRRGKRLPLKDLKTGTQADAKHARILELEPYLAAGKYIVRLTPDTEALRDQLENYPALRHDDLIDAAAYVIQLKRPGPWQSSRHKRATYYNRQLTKAGL